MDIAFEHRQSAHCENGVISNLLNHQGITLSEPMVFGIGSGLFFVYLPFIKVNFAPGFSYRPMPGSIFRKLARRLGIKVIHQRFSSPEKAQAVLDEKLAQGIPVGLQVGVYNLTYFPDEYRFHFNAHNLVVYGKEADGYLISDPVMDYTTKLTETELQRVRFAKGALPPKGHLYYLERLPERLDLENAVRKGIRQTCNDMLAPVPIVGVRAMKWVARNIRKWPQTIGVKKTNHYLGQLVRMQEEIGTGGGGFRFIYAAFLQEASALLNNDALAKRSEEMTAIGDAWRDFALDISRIYKNRKSGNDVYEKLSEQLMELAEREKQFFKALKNDI
ncbi:MAG TPA: BtrH N-terminal domain-containing protein [Parapedobacter sp.]|uniref:BtrH N-terminal domain-containing protein n=1 Tax=Parapedobacter sp. TaxID=1958893 RepID=UPI002B62AE60|nr:BtrH N-terminal domain-containing protein [Parapedobacter sp.]HWK56921.1 BtrH N-terminal domain-containing protein [Parapedobacter sp.]